MALDFPASSASPFTAPNGVLYTWNTDGYWEAKPGPNDLDSDYLKLDATNGPVTGALTFEGKTTHEAGVKVTGGDLTGPDIFNIVTPGGNSTGNRITLNEQSAGSPAFTLNGKNIASGSSNAINLNVNYNSNTDQSQSASCIFTQFNQVASSTQNVYHNFAAVNTKQSTSGNYIGYYTRMDTTDNLGSGGVYGFYAAGNAPSYFQGLTEHEGGVKVTGGTANNVEHGIRQGGDGFIRLVANSTDALTLQKAEDRDIGALNAPLGSPDIAFKIGGKTPSVDLIGTRIQCEITESNTNLTAFDVNPQYTDGSNLTSSSLYRAVLTANASLTSLSTQKGFAINSAYPSAAATNNYAFYSNLAVNTITGKNTYNFYAAGTAPSYFASEIGVGNTFITDKSAGYVSLNSSRFLSYSNSPYNLLVARDNDGFMCVFKSGGKANSDATAGFISLNGTLTSTTFNAGPGGSHTATSDYRIKENVAPLGSAIESIKLLNPVSYNFTNGDSTTYQGFIAHELQAQVAQAVTGTKDAEEAIGTLSDYDGTVLETAVAEPPAEQLEYTEDVTDEYGVSTVTVRSRTWTPTGTQPIYQGVDQTKLIPLLTKALQEALTRIEELESNTLQPLYATLADLPSATDHHGKVAHVHSEGALYFAHAGNWVKLQNA